MSLYGEVASRLAALGARRVLDVGCADGVLRSAMPPGPVVVGLDVAAAMVRAHPPPVVRGEAARLPFADAAFDAVTAIDVLYQLADPRHALREARRVLRRGGTLLARSIAADDCRLRRCARHGDNTRATGGPDRVRAHRRSTAGAIMTILHALGTDVRRAGPGDTAAVGSVLAAAFTDDPVFRWLVPDAGVRAATNREFFHVLVDLLASHDDTWTTAVGVHGAALWVPYGHEAMSEEAGAGFAARLSELFHPHADRVEQVIAAMERVHPTEPHEYLWFLGVAPDVQGRGIGSSLLAPVLERADRCGHPAYLEATSPRSRALYERHGFVAATPIAAPGGPPLWPMWRPAA
ncbi:GNAT family N-acetyltransferase [Geodermatophilus sp. YIM 151500]|uniref:GNAT family N-acetyltransferase n=1 Tax=Geodermatophilus sp. YIM 151500 TaxID=2984531 RepID=UPI0021E49083|nr:GNAT family N-acetyltransferase [Geodermatophilus sp. YIM 151500]MCV2489264.1 GNAT family N-acetyltransferase [Geodermatophilus sp. YIM 151500]